MTYYIDTLGGSPKGDGKAPASARSHCGDIPLSPGDSLLFRRGTVIRGSIKLSPGEPGRPIYYGAYGVGAPPKLMGSVNIGAPERWERVKSGLWSYKGGISSEAGSLIFDHGASAGTLRWKPDELCEPGDWYDSRLGSTKAKKTIAEPVFLLCSEDNPGKVYSSIECAVYGSHRIITPADWTVIEDLDFQNSGVHAIRGPASHLVIRRCGFSYIGGCVWSAERKIRLGNAIELWNRADNILIEDCRFDNIYDSCITHQGNSDCRSAESIAIRDCTFSNYGMAAYEGRDRMSRGLSFEGNLCCGAGLGFGAQGDTVPRRSEIYPQPMGHHIFLWRIKVPVENGGISIHNNDFFSAPRGAALYSLIAPEAERQLSLRCNRYYTASQMLIARYGNADYSPERFEEYRHRSGETGERIEL